jgi:hypothetical protein
MMSPFPKQILNNWLEKELYLPNVITKENGDETDNSLVLLKIIWMQKNMLIFYCNSGINLWIFNNFNNFNDIDSREIHPF